MVARVSPEGATLRPMRRTVAALIWLGLAAIALFISERGPDLRLAAMIAIGIGVGVAGGLRLRKPRADVEPGLN